MRYKYWFWGLIVFVVSLFFDKTIINFISQNRIFALNGIISTFTIYTNAIFSLLVIAILILIWKRKYIYRYLIGFGVFSGIIWLIKYIVQRPRPFLELDIISLIPENGYSFPSGHASLAFFSLIFVWKIFPRFKWIWLIIVVLISLARGYVGVHYFSDIIGGALLGVFFGSLFLKQKFFKFKK